LAPLPARRAYRPEGRAYAPEGKAIILIAPMKNPSGQASIYGVFRG